MLRTFLVKPARNGGRHERVQIEKVGWMERNVVYQGRDWLLWGREIRGNAR